MYGGGQNKERKKAPEKVHIRRKFLQPNYSNQRVRYPLI